MIARPDGPADVPGNDAARALRESESRFRTIFDQAAFGMCFVALDGTFLRTNRRLSEIVGYSREELACTTCVNLTYLDDRAFGEKVRTRMIAGDLPTSSTSEKRYVCKDVSLVWCNLTLTLLCDDAGVPSQKAEHSESLLQLAGRTARLGGWAYDYTTDALSWSDEICIMHDLAPGGVPSLAEVFGYYLPASRERLAFAVERCRNTGEAYDVELEITTARGRHRWVRAIGQSDGHPHRLVGSCKTSPSARMPKSR